MTRAGDGHNIETKSEVYFYTPKFYGLDNFSAFNVFIWNKLFPTAEHAYQWKKFSVVAPDLAEKILKAASPNEVKLISDTNRHLVATDWDLEKLVVMEDILREKVSQHKQVRKQLLETGSKTIYENSPTDGFWGVGPDGQGRNVLGMIWMSLRDELIDVIE